MAGISGYEVKMPTIT